MGRSRETGPRETFDMAHSRFGYPTPPPPGEDHRLCPVCGWCPCTSECRLGLLPWEVLELECLFGDELLLPPFDNGVEGDPFTPPSSGFLPPTSPEDFVDPGDFEL
jgi:hypothetical protein